MLQPAHVNAESPVFKLFQPSSQEELVGYIDHFVDDDWTMTPQQATSERASEFTPILKKNSDFGYTRSRIWLRVRLENTSETQSDWVIYFPENFKQIFNVDLVRENGSVDSLLSLNELSRFKDRPIRDPHLAAPMILAPNETATLLVSLWSEGSSYITFSMETTSSFNDLASARTAKNFIFYGMIILLIVTALIALFVLRNPLFLAYGVYALTVLLYIMHSDGVTFQYLWPNWPRFNGKASIFIGAGIIVCGSIYARMFLKTSQLHPNLDRLLLGIIGVTLALSVVLYPTDPQILKKVLVFLSLVAVISFALTGVVAAMTRYREVRFYLFAWIGAVISAVMLNLNHLLGVQMDQNFVYDSIRAVLVFDAAMMGLAIADRYTQLRHSQREELQKRLGQTRRNLELSERLTKLTNNYEEMLSTARTRDEQIQNTVHDLRQPLHSLRLNVANLIHNTGPDSNDSTRLEATFSYLEDLIDGYLIQEPATHHTHGPRPTEQGTLDLSEVLSSIKGMFDEDADAKGLEFTLSKVPAAENFDAFTVMRIVSNLVSNAIKYTDSGSVSIEAENTNGDIQIKVTDSGPGLSTQDFSHALNRDIRLADKSGGVEGSGLGLSIANDLCQKNGIRLELGPARDVGTQIIVTLPKATQ